MQSAHLREHLYKRKEVITLMVTTSLLFYNMLIIDNLKAL